MHDGVKTREVGGRGARVSLGTVILAVDTGAGIGFIERVTHVPSLQTFVGVGFGWATHFLIRAAPLRLGSGPNLSREAIVLLWYGTRGGAGALTAIVVYRAVSLVLGGTIGPSAEHVGTPEFLAVLDDTVIAAVKIVFATRWVLGAFKLRVNVQELLQ